MATSAIARQINEARVLRVLFEQGPQSRAEIARRLSLTKSAMTNVIADLLDDRLIFEADGATARGRVGRPGTDVDLNPAGAYSIGAEVLPGSIAVVALDLKGRMVGDRVVERAIDTSSAAATIAELGDAVRTLTETMLPKRAVINGLCLAIPGFVSREGHIAHAQKLGWRDVPMQGLLSGIVEGDISVENDANVSAFAEWYLAPAAERHDLLLISISTGAGAGLISQGRIIRGYNGMAGEVGQIIVDDQPSGGFDTVPLTWQTAIGRETLLAAYAERTTRDETLDGFAAALAANDAVATAIARRWAYWVARGLAFMAYAHNPERIVVGGELAPIFELVRARVEEEMQRRLASGYPAPSLATSRLGPHIASLGAAALVHSAFLRNEAEPEDFVYAEN